MGYGKSRQSDMKIKRHIHNIILINHANSHLTWDEHGEMELSDRRFI